MIHALFFLIIVLLMIPVLLSIVASVLLSSAKRTIKQGFSSAGSKQDDSDEFFTEAPLNSNGEIGRTKLGRRRLDMLKNRAVTVNFDEDFN